MSTSKRKIREEIKEFSHLLRALKTSSVTELSTLICPTHEDEPVSRSSDNREFRSKWPLLAEDVYRSSICFEEELSGQAEQQLSGELPASPDDILTGRLSASEASALAGSSVFILSRALSYLSDNFPHIEKNTQHRVKAADWKLVLSILTESELFPDEVLDVVMRRMAASYDPSIERKVLAHSWSSAQMQRAKSQFTDLEAELDVDIDPAVGLSEIGVQLP